jgi:hypothetical protein
VGVGLSVHASDHWTESWIQNIMALHFSTLCIFIMLSEALFQWCCIGLEFARKLNLDNVASYKKNFRSSSKKKTF